MSGGSLARPTATAVPEGQVLRYTFVERAIHWTNGLAYLYLMLTGLALFTPFFYWMAAVLGGGGTIRYWHPWIGLIYAATIVQMHRMWRSDIKTTDADRQWLKNVEAYAKNEDANMPPQGRFNAGQKQFYWAMFYSMLLLVVTGIVMWFPEYMPRKAHFVLPIIVFLHSAAALVSIAGFLIHVYMSIWMTPGSVKAMTDGYVSRAWAKTHHRLWYEKITGRRS
ncbi:MAG TPA: formate dehydrogenase subunit gamma [Verrucomicrobiae bacterium]|jgi:formate dehydrogenase subunit gamma|nr:formate dehydrogenase subunit gamma [Verrucomicrobiae bacterium]